MSKYLIGLTGGIATGKTTVANYLENTYDLPILDADIYARDAVAVGSPILDAIAQRYGKQILLSNGELNRPALGNIIFEQPEERDWLNRVIHPYVRDRFHQEITSSTSPVLVLVIPLLFESQMTDLVNDIWVVYCSQQQQLQRLIQRNQLTETQALARINSQLGIEEKVSRADVVLDNSSTLEILLKQIDLAYNQSWNMR